MTASSRELAQPFRGLRPAPARAVEIAAPPYDVVTTSEAQARARDKPHSFLHVSRAEIDLPAGTDPYSDVVYTTAAKNLTALEQGGLLIRDAEPCYYVYRITSAYGTQTGVVLSASVDAYLSNRILRHELTRPTKENDRVRQIDATNAITGPVLLVHRSDPGLASILTETISSSEAAAVVPSLDDARHEIWVVSEQAQVARISTSLNEVAQFYIADGHHRSAAAARVADARRRAATSATADAPYNGFLAVSFPADEVTILDYNRVVKDLNGLTTETFCEHLATHFDVQLSSTPVQPGTLHTFGMYLAGQWYQLTLKEQLRDNDPVARLDVAILDRLVIAPLLGIENPRTDPRIDFVGGTRGSDGISSRIDCGEMAVGFSLHPTSIGELFAIADSGLIMPPKSTWFTPKLADGLISLPLD